MTAKRSYANFATSLRSKADANTTVADPVKPNVAASVAVEKAKKSEKKNDSDDTKDEIDEEPVISYDERVAKLAEDNIADL